ncbi:ABC transporter, permease subunit [gamma proteobacterium HdN1]|nr:ABC transporter, permease subunit [gamma proteobacterium HdN1]
MPSMSPINQRRWKKFKANRRGYWSSIIFLVLLALCSSAEFIANDRPLVIKFDNRYYFPVFHHYAETDFGGEMETEADYRDPYVAELISEKGWMLFPPVPFRYDTINYNLPSPAPTPPDATNWLGTDDQGRDVLARVIYGFRVSVIFGVVLAIFSSVVGVSAGALQGYYGGLTDIIAQRLIEIWSSMPKLFLLIILSSVMVPTFWWLMLIMLLFNWMSLVSVVRAEFLRGRNLEYVKAAKALGMGDARIMFRHILPNAMVASITFMPFLLTSFITQLTALDFLGFGLPPGSASLGELLSQGKNNLQAPWLGISAFMVLSLMLSLLVFIGEAVRDAFDPGSR